VTPSRLRYWERTRLTRVSRPRTAGEGARDEARREAYEFRDLVGIKAVLALLEQGISLQRIRRSLEVLRDRMPHVEDPLVALRAWDDSRRVVVEHEGGWMEPDGQMLFDFDRRPAVVAPLAPQVGQPASTTSAGEYFERGCRLDAEPSSWGLAIEAYRAAIELDPDFADAYCNLGAVHYNRGKRDEARRQFERCLRLDPGHVEAHFNLANLLEEQGCSDMALHHYKAGLLADPFYPDLHINLALLYEKLDQPPRAREHWRRYLQLEPAGSWADVARLRLSRSD
jgi:tetratricopeptide (TPR) repeat protein